MRPSHPHTLELLLTDLGKAMPELDQAIAQARSLAFSFKNKKDHMRPLVQLQKAAGKTHPLTVLVPGNTRKWSSGYIVICRLLQLKPFISLVAEQPSIQLPEHSWAMLEASKDILFPFYLEEQILQRDCSNVIHMGHCWEVISEHITNAKQLLLECNRGEDAQRLEQALQRRQQMLESCGVFTLCRALWPDPSLGLQETT